MNLGQFRFEVDPTRTLARLRLEHMVDNSRRLRATRCKAGVGMAAVDDVGQTVVGGNSAARRLGRVALPS
jgi:hypothetical protein